MERERVRDTEKKQKETLEKRKQQEAASSETPTGPGSPTVMVVGALVTAFAFFYVVKSWK